MAAKSLVLSCLLVTSNGWSLACVGPSSPRDLVQVSSSVRVVLVLAV